MPLKKLVCDRVKFANINTIDSINAGVVTFKSGYDWISLTIRRAELTETLRNAAPGQSIDQILTFALAVSSANLNLIRNPSVYQLDITDGSQIIWGTLDKPVRSTKLDDSVGAGSGELARKTLQFEFT